MRKTIEIDGRLIGAGQKPYVIAEVSGNHNGDVERACKLIEIAKQSGADAVKLQTYTPDTMTIKCDRSDFKVVGGPWDGHTLYDLYQWAHTPWDWHERLFTKAREVGITCFSTPFDESSLELLLKLNAPALKLASFELLDLPLVEEMAKTKKPMIISTGMATLDEIQDAVDVVRKYHDKLVILHCVSGYPTPVDQSNLRTLQDLQHRFGSLVGLSDHTLGVTTSVVGVSLGACVIEKHFIDDRSHKGPDSAFSLEPQELADLCRMVGEAWSSLGEAGYQLKNAEKQSMVFRRSLYVTADMKAGEVLTEKNLRRIRPGFGLPPKFFREALGRKVKRDVERGTALTWELLEDK
jgi:N-acetylneuraminate synthase